MLSEGSRPGGRGEVANRSKASRRRTAPSISASLRLLAEALILETNELEEFLIDDDFLIDSVLPDCRGCPSLRAPHAPAPPKALKLSDGRVIR
jgi:hypothetical protein